MLSNEDGSELNLDLFLRILPNIQSVYIYNHGRGQYPSFPLDLSLKNSLLSAVKYINAKRGPCTSINIVNPKGNLEGFISENNAEFGELGWCLVKSPFESVFHRSYKPHPNTLCVRKMN